MYLHHFGLKHSPLGKDIRQVVPHQAYERLKQRLDNLLQTKGIGLITGAAGTGKTTAVRNWCASLNMHTHQFFYQSDNHFRAFDIYSQLSDALGLEKCHRYSLLWRLLKKELLSLQDNKQITPIWILDEAHHLPNNFLRELPAFLNFSFDTRDVLIIILIGTSEINATINRPAYSALTSRMLFHEQWQALNEFETFKKFIIDAFAQAGTHEMIISNTGLQLIHLSTKGRLRYVHKVLSQSLQRAAKENLNHLPDEIIEQTIEELKSLAG